MSLMDFEKIPEKMSEQELRNELVQRRQQIEDIYQVTTETAHDDNKTYRINQIAGICRRDTQ